MSSSILKACDFCGLGLFGVFVPVRRPRLRIARIRCRQRRLHCWRTPGEEYLHELAITESRIEFLDRGVDQKENEDPNLNSEEAVPSEVSCHVLRNRSEGSSGEKVFAQLFQESYQENDRPIDDSLKQDRSDHWSRVKTAQEWHCIRDQHRLSHNQSCYGCDHEAPKAGQVISENEVGGQGDEIEANREEHRWRHQFPELFDYECEETRLGHERIPKHPRQDAGDATRTYQPNSKSLEIFSWAPVHLQQRTWQRIQLSQPVARHADEP